MYVQEIWARQNGKKKEAWTMCRLTVLIKEQEIMLCTHYIGKP